MFRLLFVVFLRGFFFFFFFNLSLFFLFSCQAARGAPSPMMRTIPIVVEEDEVRASPLSPLAVRQASPPASPRRVEKQADTSSDSVSPRPDASPRRMSPVLVRAPPPVTAALSANNGVPSSRGPNSMDSSSRKVSLSPRLKQPAISAYDSDLDEGSVSEKEMAQVHTTMLSQMSAAKFVEASESPPPPLPVAEKPVRFEKEEVVDQSADAGNDGGSAKRSRLEKSRGSVSLPKKGKEVVGESKGNEKEVSTPPSVARQGTLRGLFSRLKRDEDEEEDREMVISPPMNVQHEKHVGKDNLDTAELSKIFPAKAEENKAPASPAVEKKKSRPKSLKLFATLRGKPKEGSGAVPAAANDDDDGGLSITGPTEVQHQGHVDVADAKATNDVVAVVSDAIDSVKNKEKPVDTESIFVEEIKFAEEYIP